MEDAVSALTCLGLTPEDGAELCLLAGALARKPVSELHHEGGVAGGGGRPGQDGPEAGGAADVVMGLDFAARGFLVAARLAAAGARAEAAAAGADDDGEFAAAVSRLFRCATLRCAASGLMVWG